MGFIYKITNIVNGKLYIGQTEQLDPNKRWQSHKSSIKHNSGCPLLSAAVNKYGINSFKFEVLIICFDEDRYNYEKEYILKYNTLAPNGYNATKGGEPGGNFKGKTHTEKTKLILKNKATIWNNNPENKKKIRDFVHRGMLASEKWKKAKEENRVGTHKYNRQPKLDETKTKISSSLKQFYETNIVEFKKRKPRNGRSICQYSPTNILLNSFINAAEASRQIGIGRKNIQANLSGRNKTAGGFIWKYDD
jgi:group I intron endonuclease